METTLDFTPNKVKKHLEQANQMAEIWEESDEVTRAYLKGCISTAAALTKKDSDEKEAG